jgi:ApaG protein
MKKIIVTVKPGYEPVQSDPDHQKFVWSYEITIRNKSDEIVQLLNRLWQITDMTGRIEEIRGVGVIGMQPIIKPEKEFVYTSFCQLTTPQGTMEGHYEMQNLDEEHFVIEIPQFMLSAPSSITKSFRSKLH